MSAEYDEFEESLLREAKRRSSPRGAKARAVAAVVAASASASVGITFGRHLLALELWAKSAGLPTIVAMIAGSAIYIAMVDGNASAERVRPEEAPGESVAALSPEVPSESTTPVEVTSNVDADPVDVVPAERTKASLAQRAPSLSAPARPAAPMPQTADAPTTAASEDSESSKTAETPPASGLGQLGRENALVHTAQSALRRGDNRSAFEALDQHEQQFGASGALASEAELLRIEALARTGRRAEAEARARLLITSQPRSSLVRRVRVILGRDGATR